MRLQHPSIGSSRSRPAAAVRCGFTLTELLTALAVLSLLSAIALPAVQQARGRARAVACLNNVRQLGIASHAHQGTRGAFPLTSLLREEDGQVHPSTSPHAQLLPYLEHLQLYNEIDFADRAPDFKSPPTTMSAQNAALLSVTVPVFLCPDDEPRPGATNYRACVGPEAGPLREATGPFINGRGVRPQDFHDGLSHTILFSERVLGDQDDGQYSPWRDVFLVPAGPAYADVDEWRETCGQGPATTTTIPSQSFLGATWLWGGFRHTWYDHVLPPNSTIPDCALEGPYSGGAPGAYSARSHHAGGVHVVMGDGAARFIAQSIDLAVWRALATRSGEETVSESF